MTEPLPNERRIDALCDAFVEDYCALDPLTATAIGVAGHEDELTDFSPAGFDAREALARDTAIAAIDGDAAVPWPADLPVSGDVVWLQPGHCDPTINLYDAFYVADEDGRLERWPIDARRVSP